MIVAVVTLYIQDQCTLWLGKSRNTAYRIQTLLGYVIRNNMGRTDGYIQISITGIITGAKTERLVAGASVIDGYHSHTYIGMAELHTLVIIL